MNKGYSSLDQATAFTGRLDSYPRTAAEVVKVGGYAASPTAEALARANEKAGQLSSLIDALLNRLQPAMAHPYPATPEDPKPVAESDLVRQIDDLGEAFACEASRLRDILTRLAL